MKNNTWKMGCRKEGSPDSNIVNGRFVLAIKDEGTNKELWEVRFVVQGYKDAMKQSMIHNTPIFQLYLTYNSSIDN